MFGHKWREKAVSTMRYNWVKESFLSSDFIFESQNAANANKTSDDTFGEWNDEEKNRLTDALKRYHLIRLFTLFCLTVVLPVMLWKINKIKL